MANLYLLVGVQGAGKTTWAMKNQHQLSAVVVSSDEIRNELEAAGHNALDGDKVFDIFSKRVNYALRAGNNVIADATHARRNWRYAAIDIARQHRAVVIVVWFDVPLELALRRNAMRQGARWGERSVPEEEVRVVAEVLEPPLADECDAVWRKMD